MKTSDFSDLPPLEKITLPTSPTPGRMETFGREKMRADEAYCMTIALYSMVPNR